MLSSQDFTIEFQLILIYPKTLKMVEKASSIICNLLPPFESLLQLKDKKSL